RRIVLAVGTQHSHNVRMAEAERCSPRVRRSGSKDLVEDSLLGGSETPEGHSIAHLGNEHTPHELNGDGRAWRAIAMVDPRDEIGSELAFGSDSIKLLIPPSIALEE